MKKTEEYYPCPHCEKALPRELIEQIAREAITAKGQKHIAKVNASLTAEKRKKAAAKVPPDERRARAIKAARARWSKVKKTSPAS